MKYKLSICMMVKDEEVHIERCLESIKPIINRSDVELIIVDTGSTDKTVNICEKYTDKLYFKKWFDDFSGMRNITISYATGEWIFILDADETLEKYNDLEIFLDSKIYETTEYNTYSITGKNYTNLKNTESYSLFPTMRIFRNDRKFKYDGSVHNQPVYSKPVGKLDIIIGHYGYVTSNKEIMDKKFIRTKTLLERELKKDPNNLYYLYQLAVSYNMHGEVRKSYEISSKIYKLFNKLDIDRQRISFSVITNHLSNCRFLNKSIELIEACKLAISIKNDYIDGYYLLGQGYEKIGNYNSAVEYYEKYIELCELYPTLNISKDHSIALYRNNITDNNNVRLFLAMFYFNSENYAKALLNLKDLKNNIHIIKLYINIFLKLEKYIEIEELYKKIINENDELKTHFINYIESELLELDFRIQKEVYNLFLEYEDIYGIYSKFMVTDDAILKGKLAKKIIDLNNNKNSVLVNNPLSYLIVNKGYDLKLFSKMDENSIMIAISYFKDKQYNEIYLGLDEWLMNIDIQILRIKDVGILKYIFKAKLKLLLREYRETGMDSYINDNIYLFNKYLDLGMIYISEMYNLNGMSIKYEFVNDIEVKFLLLIYIFRENFSKGNTKAAFKYYKLAAEAYPAMADFLKENINLNISEI